jgi:hypothetical protein
VLAGDRGNLIADGDEGVKPFVSGNVEVCLQLLCLELVASSLDLNQGRPGFVAAANADQPVGVTLLVPDRERHFDVRLDVA